MPDKNGIINDLRKETGNRFLIYLISSLNDVFLYKGFSITFHYNRKKWDELANKMENFPNFLVAH